MPSEHRVILFADIAESTALYRRLGDAEAHRRIAEALKTMATAVELHQGQVLRTVGDSTLASFAAPSKALLAAIEMQQRMQHGMLSLRVGFHAGEVIPDMGDVYGDAVNMAARLADYARAGEIIASSSTVESFDALQRPLCQRLDAVRVKGIDEPVAIERIRWQNPGAEGSTTLVAGIQDELQARQAILLLEADGQAVALHAGEQGILIGRSQDCELCVHGEQSSRRHAHIESRDGLSFMVQDLSTNGTWLQRPGQAPIVLRRQGILLDGAGELGIGGAPGDAGVAVVRFRLERSRQ